jgi:hypothetical protein
MGGKDRTCSFDGLQILRLVSPAQGPEEGHDRSAHQALVALQEVVTTRQVQKLMKDQSPVPMDPGELPEAPGREALVTGRTTQSNEITA